jgi:uncharacterized protein (TIGR04255 family)
VSRRSSHIPAKLKHDAILEALFELRFETTTSPEFLLVRFADFKPWEKFTQSRLPAYGIPDQIRRSDPNLLYQPIFELLDSANQRSVRIGSNVLSYHLRSPYNGWASFGAELRSATQILFDKADALCVSRIGLRYVNALTVAEHGIRGVSDLDVKICVGEVDITSGINVLVNRTISADMSSRVRIATPDFVLGSLPEGTTIVADVDVFTPDTRRRAVNR